MTTLHLRKSINLSPFRLGFLLIPLMLVAALGFRLRASFRCEPGHQTEAMRELTPLRVTMRFFSRPAAVDNTGLGFQALYQQHHRQLQHGRRFSSALISNTTGAGQHGQRCIRRSFCNTTGSYNTATGRALRSIATLPAAYNTASRCSVRSITTQLAVTIQPTGYNALVYNTTGVRNTADGAGALLQQHNRRATTRPPSHQGAR